jgi:hypothetical protein
MTENGFYVIGAPRGVCDAGAPAAAVTQTHIAEGPTVIEAVIDSDHYIGTVDDCP